MWCRQHSSRQHHVKVFQGNIIKTIFLHAGKHKTGTTSIQYYLKKNNEHFNNLGV